MSNRSSTGSISSRCWPVRQARLRTPGPRRFSSRRMGAILIASGRVPRMLRTIIKNEVADHLPPPRRPLFPTRSGKANLHSGSPEDLEHALQAARADRILPRIEESLLGPAQIKLEEKPDAVGSAVAVADGFDAVAVAQEQLPGVRRRAVEDSSAHARVPVAGLFETGDVVHHGATRGGDDGPALIGAEGKRVVARQHGEGARRDFLEVIARKHEGEL